MRPAAFCAQEVEIKVLHAAALELLLEDLGGLEGLHARDVLMAGELVGEHPALARVAGERPAETYLGHAAVIGIGGVVIIHAGGYGGVHHPVDLRLIDAAVREQGQAHCAEAERGELEVLKIVIQHGASLLLFDLAPLYGYPTDLTSHCSQEAFGYSRSCRSFSISSFFPRMRPSPYMSTVHTTRFRIPTRLLPV